MSDNSHPGCEETRHASGSVLIHQNGSSEHLSKNSLRLLGKAGSGVLARNSPSPSNIRNFMQRSFTTVNPPARLGTTHLLPNNSIKSFSLGFCHTEGSHSVTPHKPSTSFKWRRAKEGTAILLFIRPNQFSEHLCMQCAEEQEKGTERKGVFGKTLEEVLQFEKERCISASVLSVSTSSCPSGLLPLPLFSPLFGFSYP